MMKLSGKIAVWGGTVAALSLVAAFAVPAFAAGHGNSAHAANSHASAAANGRSSSSHSGANGTHGQPTWVATLKTDLAAMKTARQGAISERLALNTERVSLVQILRQAVAAGDTTLVQSALQKMKAIETMLAAGISKASAASRANVTAQSSAQGSNHSAALTAIANATARWQDLTTLLTQADQAMTSLVTSLQSQVAPPPSGSGGGSGNGTGNSTGG